MEESKKKEKEEANEQVSNEISLLQVKRQRILEHCSALRDSAETLCYQAEIIHLRKRRNLQQEADDFHVLMEALTKKLKH